MKISDRYSPGVYLAAGGFLLAFGINAINIPASLMASSRKDEIATKTELEKVRLQAQADLNTARAKEQKATADALADNQTTSTANLQFQNYADGASPPSFDPANRGLFPDPQQKTLIWDANRVCVGAVQNNKFIWIRRYPDACG